MIVAASHHKSSQPLRLSQGVAGSEAIKAETTRSRTRATIIRKRIYVIEEDNSPDQHPPIETNDRK